MYINGKKVKDELTGNWRREFIEKFTKELQKSPYSYSLKEANDIAMKRADNEQNKRFDNVDAMVRHNLSNTLTKAQYEKEYNDSKVKDTYVWGKKNGKWVVVGGCFAESIDKVYEKFKKGEIYQDCEDIRINRDNKKPKDSIKDTKYTIKSISKDGEYYLANGWGKRIAMWVKKEQIRPELLFNSIGQAKASLTKLLQMFPEYKSDTFEEVSFNDSIVKDDIQINEKDKEFFQKVMPQLVATFVKHYKREPTEQEIAELRKVGSIGVGMAKAFRTMAGKDTIKDDIKIEFIGVMFEFVEGHHPNIDRNMNKVFSLNEINKILEQEDRVAYEQNSKHGGMYDKCAFYGIFKINGERYKVQLTRRIDLGDGVKYGKQEITLTNEDIEKTKRSILNNGRYYAGGLKKLDSKKKDSKMKDETIRTPRGTFVLTEKTEEELKKEGYGYHHSSDDGRYKIYVKNNQAVAVKSNDSKARDAKENLVFMTIDKAHEFQRKVGGNIYRKNGYWWIEIDENRLGDKEKEIYRSITDSKVKDTNFSSRLKLYADTFYATDFKDGNDAKRWWVNEFKKASNMKSKELKEWAEDMLDYTKDISVPYIKEDTTNLLKDIVKGKVTDSLKTFKVNGKVVKAKDEFDAVKKVRDAKYEYSELMKMFTGQKYGGWDIFKENGKYCVNPNISDERYNTLEELKKRIDKNFRDSKKKR